MSEEQKKTGAPSSDETSALFVTARKKQIAEQEAQRKAAEEEAKRLAAEEEVRRMEAEVADRKRQAEDEARRIAAEEAAMKKEAEERRRQAQREADETAERIKAEAKAKAEAEAEAGIKDEPLPAAKVIAGLKKVKSGPKEPKAPKAPKEPKSPPAAAEGAKPKNSKKLLLFGGIGLAVIIVVVVVMVLIGKGSGGGDAADEAGYGSWVEPLSISVDDYLTKSDSEKASLCALMQNIISSQIQAQTTSADEFAAGIEAYEGDTAAQGSAFQAACSVDGVDGSLFQSGDTEAFGDAAYVVNMSCNDFIGLRFTTQLGAVVLMNQWMTEQDVMSGFDLRGALQQTADIYTALTGAAGADPDAEGGFFTAFCTALGLDGDTLFPEFQNFAAEGDIALPEAVTQATQAQAIDPEAKLDASAEAPNCGYGVRYPSSIFELTTEDDDLLGFTPLSDNPLGGTMNIKFGAVIKSGAADTEKINTVVDAGKTIFTAMGNNSENFSVISEDYSDVSAPNPGATIHYYAKANASVGGQEVVITVYTYLFGNKAATSLTAVTHVMVAPTALNDDYTTLLNHIANANYTF